ncbi:MAG TPA: cyclic beta 1-2 glucan synthetase, partial [Burkholderiaceae bacterium]|nr:cyclic beta 1-2 glucan synthetase [Burkholderiaceae bacterium]
FTTNATGHDDSPLVTEGYGILQPRVTASLTGTNRSLYARLSGGESGIDPYTRTVSDVYQDMFGEGSFIGKGIYDVDAFERALNTRFPENRILSHDLLEGCYARSGLLSDVLLVEDYPARYGADVSRRYRWIRGDWQLASWSLPRPFGRRDNPLSALSRWKLFDNLRRSLTPIALMLLLLLGWTILAPAWFWTLAVIGIILTPPLTCLVLDLFRKPRDVLLTQHLAATTRSAGRYLAQATFALACLAHEAYYSLDAIVRTATRMLFTHKRLLEWKPSGEPERTPRTSLVASWRSMWISPALAASTAMYLALVNPAALAVAWPILLLWFVAPTVAWWISRPRVRRAAALSAAQTIFLQKIARKTWAFFETFVGPQDNWLPPDNFQEYRVALVAHRTSPTNMGLALLANLSAYDFGYIPAGQLIERTANALRTMQKLERHHGHFYNWYDTESLAPLHPLYVSTVDSGNLAGSLLTLRQGLLALADDQILGKRFFHGMRDTLRLLVDAARASAPSRFTQLQNNLESTCEAPPTTLAQARVVIGRLATDIAQVTIGFDTAPESETNRWLRALTDQCRSALDELTLLAPWSLLSAAPQKFSEVPGLVEIPSLRQLAQLETQCLPVIEQWLGADTTPEESHWLSDVQRLVMQASAGARERIDTIERLALESGELVRMEHDFLFDGARKLFTIGYNVSERRRDSSCYDLLASEARLSNFLAIAHGQLPQESWFALGRLLTRAGGAPILLSWSGSMFEYLMPQLVMPSYEGTLLDQTARRCVERQVAYG